jgi:Cytochrome P460
MDARGWIGISIEKDSKRFPDTHGWAYAEFAYDAASDTFTPTQKDAKCGAACHTIAHLLLIEPTGTPNTGNLATAAPRTVI